MSEIRYVVTKAPVDLAGTAELVGVYRLEYLAHQACDSPGTYTIAEMEVGRTYRSGELLNVKVVRILDHRESSVRHANGH